MKISVRSQILKKFAFSTVVFLVIMIGVNVVINFEIKQIKNKITEKNALIGEKNTKAKEVIDAKNIEDKIKEIENGLGINIADLRKILKEEIKQPNLSQISMIFEGIAEKSSSQITIKQEENGKIEGNWFGTLNDFGDALQLLRRSNFAIKLDEVQISPSVDSQSQQNLVEATSSPKKDSKRTTKQKKFVIKFKISIL